MDEGRSCKSEKILLEDIFVAFHRNFNTRTCYEEDLCIINFLIIL